jgi:hypothetical protein
MDLDGFAALLPGAKPARRGGFVARCPSHDDTKPSLSFRQGDKGIVVHCFAGCTAADVTAALGLAVADLFNDDPEPVVVGRQRPKRTKYEIRAADGTLQAVHERVDRAGGKDFYWYRADGTPGLNGTAPDDLPLYGTELAASWPAGSVLIVEGEKDADAVRAAGLPALGTLGASTTPTATALGVLSGSAVILAPDNDDAGRRHMERVGEVLEDMAAVGWLEWPDVPVKGGAADYLATHTADDLRQLLTTARAWPLEDDASQSAVAWRTLADVPDDPPGSLLLGMFEPDGQNLGYGAPGTGKGTTGAWIVGEVQRLGMLPVIYDPERRPREWSRRVAGLGGDRSRVIYIDPMDLPKACRGKPLWDVAEAIGDIVAATGADILIVDSIVPAVGVGEERLKSDAQVPYLYVAALDALGIPSLSFGHPPKGQPEGDPYGSMAWLGAMRLTWLATKAEGDGHRIRWRPRKRNERGHIPGVLLTVDYGDDGRPCAVTRSDDDESTRDWLLAGLAGGPRGVADLAEEMLDEVENPTAGEPERVKERLGRMLRRMARDGIVRRIGGAGRGAQWERVPEREYR